MMQRYEKGLYQQQVVEKFQKRISLYI